MRAEIERLKQEVQAVVEILRNSEKLTIEEENTVASEIGKLRSELGLWRKRVDPN